MVWHRNLAVGWVAAGVVRYVLAGAAAAVWTERIRHEQLRVLASLDEPVEDRVRDAS